MSDKTGLAHVRELAERKSKLYELTLALETNTDANAACFQSLAGAIDRALFHEVSLDESALAPFKAKLSAPAEDLAAALAALDAACAKAEPGRDCIRILFSGFPKWVASASGDASGSFLEILPYIAAHLKDLGNSGVEELIAILKGCASAQERSLIVRCAGAYQETSGEIILASAQIGARFLRTNAEEWIERMIAAVTLEAMLDSKDSRVLLPTLAKIQITGGSESAQSAATAVCLAVAEHNHSSSLNLARQIGGAADSLPHEARVPYLKAFIMIVESAGVALNGYGLKQLPALFQKAGPEHANAFVAEGVEMAHRYGKVAAQEFLEQKTAAARQAAAST